VAHSGRLGADELGRRVAFPGSLFISDASKTHAMNRPREHARIGLLFVHDFDRVGMQAQPQVAFDHAGFDLFRFPSQLALPWFDLDRFVARQSRRGQQRQWQGVHSAHEQYGALAAALVAEQLSLPGTSPAAIVAAQHKVHARRVLQAVAPEANLAFEVLDAAPGSSDLKSAIDRVRFPAYVKPVKAAFSILARRVETPAELQTHMNFSRWEQRLMGWLIHPFEQVRARLLPEADSAFRMLLEAPVDPSTPQYNLDGFVQHGEVQAIGVVDAILYPGTQAFRRWDLPSRLSPEVQARALDIARRFLQAIGFQHGLFNLEFFHDPQTDRITVIECNPRMAAQFSDLYRRVIGLDLHALALQLALGRDARQTPRLPPTARVASSLVYRSFPGESVPAMPDHAQQQALSRACPDALLFCMHKRAAGVARDYQWTGSHRYGLLHLGAQSWHELAHRAREASHLIGWPTDALSDKPSS